MLVVEDLHWMDDASGAFLDQLAGAVVDTRLLLLTTYRPEHEAAWTRHAPHAELSLAPLDSAAADALLADLLGKDASLDGLAGAIEQRTGGNPFFIEEIVQALAETGRLAGAPRQPARCRPRGTRPCHRPCRRCSRRGSTGCPPVRSRSCRRCP